MADTAGFDLANLISQAKVTNTQLEQGKQQVVANQGQAQEAYSAIYDAILGGTVDKDGNTPLSAQAAQLAKLGAQNRSEEFKAAIGNSGDASSRITMQLAEQLQNLGREVVARSAHVQELRNTNLIDDPLGFIVADTALPDLEQRLKATSDQHKQVFTALNEINTSISQNFQTETSTAPILTKAAIDSQIAGMQNNLLAAAQKSRLDALQSNTQNVMQVMQLNEHQLQNTSAVLTAKHNEESMAMRKQEFGLRVAEWNEKLKDKQHTREAMEEMARVYNLAAAKDGLPLLENEKQFRMMQIAKPDFFKAVFQRGISLEGNTSDGKVIPRDVVGFDPSQAYKYLKTTQGTVAPADENAVKILKQAEQQYVADRDAGIIQKGAEDQHYNAIVRKIADSQRNVFAPTDTNSPFRAADLPSLGKQAAVANSPFWQKVVAPQVTAGTLKEVEAPVLWKLGMAAVLNKTVSVEEFAQGFTNIATANAAIIDARNNFTKFGIQGPERQEMVVPVSGLLFGENQRKVNVMNVNEIRNIASLDAKRQQRNALGTGEAQTGLVGDAVRGMFK